MVSFVELSLNVLLFSLFSYFLSGQHLDDDHFNWKRLLLYTFFIWLMCIYYQAISQLIGSLLIDHQLFAILATILIYAIITLFNGLYVKLHRTTHVFFEEIGNSIGVVYPIRGIHYAIFVYDRCKGEGQYSEVTIDFHIEAEKMNIYVIRVLVNVLAVKAMALLVLYIKFNDWKGKIPNEKINQDVLLLESKNTPSNNVTIEPNSIVSEEAARLENKIVIAWRNLSLFGDNSIYDVGFKKNKFNQPILRNLDGKFRFGSLNALMGTSGSVGFLVFTVKTKPFLMFSNRAKLLYSKFSVASAKQGYQMKRKSIFQNSLSFAPVLYLRKFLVI